MTESQGGPHARRRRRSSSRQGPPPEATPTEHPGPADQPAPRRRRRSSSRQGPPSSGVATEPAIPVEQPAPKRRRSQQRTSRDPGERGLHDLIGAGGSQLGVSGALRGRDVNRPTEQDLAEAERESVIVRRNWKPAP